MKRLYFKPSLAEAKRSTQRSMDYYRSISAVENPERFDAGAKEKRERGPVNLAESEAPVQRAVNHLLAVHPKVALAIRMNAGMANTDAGGIVRFHWIIKGEGRIGDNFGLLVDGRPFAIECKKPSWKRVSQGDGDTARREQRQQAFIKLILSVGGIGGFVRSVDEAAGLLDETIKGYLG